VYIFIADNRGGSVWYQLTHDVLECAVTTTEGYVAASVQVANESISLPLFCVSIYVRVAEMKCLADWMSTILPHMVWP